MSGVLWIEGAPLLGVQLVNFKMQLSLNRLPREHFTPLILMWVMIGAIYRHWKATNVSQDWHLRVRKCEERLVIYFFEILQYILLRFCIIFCCACTFSISKRFDKCGRLNWEKFRLNISLWVSKLHIFWSSKVWQMWAISDKLSSLGNCLPRESSF